MALNRRAALARWVPLIALGLLGGAIALLVAGRVHERIGPFDTTLSARASLHGNTRIQLAPLGSIEVDTHDAPVRLDVRVDELRTAEARRIAENPAVLSDVQDDIAGDARHALGALALRCLVVSAVGGALLCLVWARQWRAGAVGAACGLLLVTITGGAAAASWRPKGLAEPRYSGLLTLAPQAVGDVRDVLEQFSRYRTQLSSLVANVSRLYQTTEQLQSFAPDARTIRVLHVSDLHLNPEGFDLIRQVSRQFRVDAIVDTGDINDWGTALETQFVDNIGTLGVPYVFVRGNHDSATTQAAVAGQKNAVVLDGTARKVAGLTFWGIGDPRFTPDKSAFKGADEGHDQAVRFADTVASRLRAAGTVSGTEPDVVLVHDPATAAKSGALVPLILAGHLHRQSQRRVSGTLELVEGSTGGAGLRGLQRAQPVALTCSVLYFDGRTRRLQAYDAISVAGVATGGVHIERHVVARQTATTTTTTTTTNTTAP